MLFRRNKKSLGLLLAVIILLLLSSAALAMTERSAAPLKSNPGWEFFIKSNSENPYPGGLYKNDGIYYGNCTWYVFGRAWEVLGYRPTGLAYLGNAGTWYNNVTQYQKNKTTPRAGSIACWSVEGGNGHVAFVEKVNSNGTITISESNWGYNYPNGKYFRVRENVNPSNYVGTFQGYIYLDVSSNTRPTIRVDEVSSSGDEVFVRGWACDTDRTDESVDVHIYAIQNGSAVFLGHATADGYRKDVDDVFGYGAYHGFAATLKTNLTGEAEIWAYAIDRQDSSLHMLGDIKTVNIVPSAYSVRYDANGGSGAPETQLKTTGVSLTLSSTIPARAGYYFIGWAVGASSEIAAYQPGDEYTEDKSMILYAIWRKNNLPVMNVDEVMTWAGYASVRGWAYDPDDTEASTDIHVYLVQDGNATYIGSTPANKERSDVDDAFGCGENHGFSAILSTTINGDAELRVYAIDAQNKDEHTLGKVFNVNIPEEVYTIRYDPNGKDTWNIPEDQVFTGSTTISDKIPLRFGYTFAGWKAAVIGPPVIYQPGDAYTRHGGSTLIAQWTPLQMLVLPESLMAIESEAFMGDNGIVTVTIPPQCVSIGSRAFADCPSLTAVRIYGGTSTISADAFDGCSSSMVVYCSENSAAHAFAEEKGLAFVLLPE